MSAVKPYRDRFSRSDEAVARWLAEREPENGDILRTAVLALTLARREGHTALPLVTDGGSEGCPR
jgi:hypothetical protein